RSSSTSRSTTSPRCSRAAGGGSAAPAAPPSGSASSRRRSRAGWPGWGSRAIARRPRRRRPGSTRSEFPSDRQAQREVVLLRLLRVWRIAVEALDAVQAPVEVLQELVAPRALQLDAGAGPSGHVVVRDDAVGQ